MGVSMGFVYFWFPKFRHGFERRWWFLLGFGFMIDQVRMGYMAGSGSFGVDLQAHCRITGHCWAFLVP
jgi:hypothetical protein